MTYNLLSIPILSRQKYYEVQIHAVNIYPNCVLIYTLNYLSIKDGTPLYCTV